MPPFPRCSRDGKNWSWLEIQANCRCLNEKESSMTTESNEDPYSPNVMKKLCESGMRVQTPAATQLFWERMLDNRDREGLGGDLKEVLCQYFGPIRMWMHLRGVSPARSIIEVAFGLNLLSETDKNWLLREVGEDEQIVQEAIDSAVLSKKLVLVERQRHAYWRGGRIQVDWNKYLLYGLFCGNSRVRRSRTGSLIAYCSVRI